MSQPLTSQQQTDVSLAIWIADRIAQTAARCARHLDRDDLTQIARTALVDAAFKFDAAKGVPFEKFAWKRVMGSVLRALGRESKRYQRALRAFLEMLEVLEVGDGFDDNDDDVSARIDYGCDDAAFVLFLSLSADNWQADGEQGFARREASVNAKRLTREALGTLSDVQRQIVHLRYWEEVDWAGVVDRVGLSKTTVQYHERRARDQLRSYVLGRGLKGSSEEGS